MADPHDTTPEDRLSPASARLLAAEWVLPVVSEPIRDGIVAVEDGRIAWVGARRDLPSRFLRAPLRAFPRSLLLPGWVNAHSHLDLTAALGLVQGTADRFDDWLRSVSRFRAQCPSHVLRQSVVAGLDLLGSTGTTTVAHASPLPELEPFLDHPMRSVVFHEIKGFRTPRAEVEIERAEEWLDGAEALIVDAGTPRVTLGLAPLATYSVSPALFQGAARLASERSLPLTVHVAETRAEEELLRTGAGPFRTLLEEQGEWEPGWTPPGTSPVQYLEQCGLLRNRGLAVPCNYLAGKDVHLLARGRLAPVWCPGSSLFFGLGPHPALALFDAGAGVALGTESLASNAGLNMLREVRLAAGLLPEVPRSAWLRAGTLSGAEALGLGSLTGSLERGKAADVQVLDGVPEEETDPLAALLTAPLRVRLVLVDGVEMKIR